MTTNEQLAEALDDYCRRLESGAAPDPEAFLADHPDIASELQECLEGLGEVFYLRQCVQRFDPLDPADAPTVLPGQQIHRRASEQAASAPERIGEYEIVRELGRGGMGVVYEAWQPRLGRSVALKVMAHCPLKDKAQKRFEAESRLAASLRHPGMVTVYEVGQTDSHPYLCMELVKGPSLADRLRAGPLPIRCGVELVRQITQAIDYAHRSQIVHRDLKPANILLDSATVQSKEDRASEPPHEEAESNIGHPKIIDFGLSRLLEQDMKSMRLTMSGEIMGTPSYMSPEQAAGNSARVGPQADIYSLGAILYEILTGRPPFLGATVTDTLLQVCEQEPAAPHTLNYRVSLDLSAICLKCLEKTPRRRYETAAALDDDLSAFLEGRPVQARPDSMWTRWRRNLDRDRHPEVIQRRTASARSKAVIALCVCSLVAAARIAESPPALIYVMLLLGGIFLVFWRSPRRSDPLIERQISEIWLVFLLSSVMVGAINHLLHLPPFQLSPIIAVLAGMALCALASLLSGWFYIGGLTCLAAAPFMALSGRYDFLILGLIMFLALWVPTLRPRRG